MSCSIAVIPAAGFGTRMYPLTHYVAKELLPLGSRPALDYIMKELKECGIRDVVIVSSDEKKPYFETYSKECQKTHGITCHITIQKNPLGLGHAVLCAKNIVGDNQFVVALPDDILIGQNPTKYLMEAAERIQGSAILCQRVDLSEVDKYGIVKTKGDSRLVSYVVEKPKRNEAPSNIAVIGRYCFSPHLWDKLEESLQIKLDSHGSQELDLTLPMNKLVEASHKITICEFHGLRHDIGKMDGYLKAFCDLARA